MWNHLAIDAQMRNIELVTHDATWSRQYSEAVERLLALLGPLLVRAHHIGSTAIPDIKSKNTIDILLEVESVEELERLNGPLSQTGYVSKGAYGIEGRRFYVKGGESPTHHLHAYEVGHPEIERHVLFKNYLIAHPSRAKEYERVKEEAAHRFRHDPLGYSNAKSKIIAQIDAEARRLS